MSLQTPGYARRARSMRPAPKLLATTALAALCLLPLVPAATAQTANAGVAATRSFAISAQPLSAALNAFGRQAGMQVTLAASTSRGLTSRPVNGSYTPQQALSLMLEGSGLPFRITPDGTVVVGRQVAAEAVPVAPDGVLLLDVIEVSSGHPSSSHSPYRTPGPVAFISEGDIDHFRGYSPADMFRGTPGVMSGEARNGAGSIDVNIRGMQGFGRVATTIDGAENATSVYQGYQGVSNRTFVDPDLLAGIDIQKGSDVSSRGIAGTVAMRTLNADDIIKPGDSWGMRVKGGFGTNTAAPNAGDAAGFNFQNIAGGYPTVTPSSTGLDRPAFLAPTSGSGSAVVAVKEEGWDLLAAYAYRKQGNYFAGSNGPSAAPVLTGPQPYCMGTTCYPAQAYRDYAENGGLANYRSGEEVLNTQLETHSLLTKATLRFADDQTLQLGYSGFRSEAGDMRASLLTGSSTQSVQQDDTAGASVDTFTTRYRWNPSGNSLINLSANLWLTNLEMRNPSRSILTPQSIGLPGGSRTGSDATMWGADATNISSFALSQYGDLDLTLGLSFLSEDASPTSYAFYLDNGFTPRDGQRQEAAAFTKAAYKPVDWLTLNGGLRYAHFWSHDRAIPANLGTLNPEPDRDGGGFSPSAGVTIEPVKGAQFYVNYSNVLRFPSLVETVSAFSLTGNPDVDPERSSNWEIGANFMRDGLFTDKDRAMLKLQYFNWTVQDYIARAFVALPGGAQGMQIFNIDQAKFSGLELSARYENSGFTAELGANYYLDVAYCQSSSACESKSLYGDFATNFVPPEYSASLTVSQKMFDDAFTLGGRVSYNGPRAIAHGQVTAQGASQFIALVDWDPYWLVDVYADYKINETWTAGVRVENLLDEYYVDPLGLVQQPGPGRTFYATLTGTFGGADPVPRLSGPFGRGGAGQRGGWTGLYAGGHVGAGFAALNGTTTALDGTPGGIPGTESMDQDFAGVLYGGQIGYAYQFANRFVVGIEADWSRTHLGAEQAAMATEGTLADSGYLQSKIHHDIEWMSTLRARLGYAVRDDLLVYGTGGFAFAREMASRDQYRSNGAMSTDPYGTSTSLFEVEQVAGTRSGFSVGGGAEYALNDRWSIKAEYNYAYFPKKSTRLRTARAGVTRSYSSVEQVGAEQMPSLVEQFPDDPEVIDYCAAPPDDEVRCSPYEEPIHGLVNHVGTSEVMNGRDASNSLGAHLFKIGLNYRF
ncbi:TonB-dependent receptor [Azorhizobium oxalatiphilum]|uniref:TonB-dependent receptor n=1 Tax=Azorhizobium oxalatiphilum TaxID=980631 RepID=A0A917C6W7_9HYPH|nr:TonB-dependent receptor [Azorhizobium oxalatiphilum]GGF71819.1 TonB-dependent receptor [Azorhizobium oxalatiphilum]